MLRMTLSRQYKTVANTSDKKGAERRATPMRHAGYRSLGAAKLGEGSHRDRTTAGKARRAPSHAPKKPVMTEEVEEEEPKKHTSISDSRYSLAGQSSIRTDRRKERQGVTRELHQKNLSNNRSPRITFSQLATVFLQDSIPTSYKFSIRSTCVAARD